MNWRTLRTPAFLLTMTVLLLSSLGMGAAIAHYKLTLRKLPIYPPSGSGHALRELPAKAGRWIKIGPDRVEEGEVLESLGTSNYLTRTYAMLKPGKTGAGGADDYEPNSVIEFHTAYYTGMIDTVPHVPDRCFVAGGMQLAGLARDVPLPLDQGRWREDKDATGPLAGHLFTMYAHDRTAKPHLPRDPQDLKLHCTKFTSRGHDLYAGYFFVANGGAVARAEGVRLLAFDLHSRYAYYLKVQFTSGNVGSEDELAGLAASFLDEMFGELMDCVPDWVEVEAGNYPPDNPAGKSGDKKS